jgi:hypothetical protein
MLVSWLKLRSVAGGMLAFEHDPEKACPALDAGWSPVSGKDHAPAKSWSGMTIRRKVITL